MPDQPNSGQTTAGNSATNLQILKSFVFNTKIFIIQLLFKKAAL